MYFRQEQKTLLPRFGKLVAEGTGFEPAKRFLPYRISSAAHSTGLCQPSVSYNHLST